MNGRVYDPKLGRMLSPDPVTQAPENGQNYNRYTYAYNNPLKYTDPSGYEAKKKTVCYECISAPGYSASVMGETVVTAPRLNPNIDILGSPAALSNWNAVGQEALTNSVNNSFIDQKIVTALEQEVQNGSIAGVTKDGDLVDSQGNAVVVVVSVGNNDGSSKGPSSGGPPTVAGGFTIDVFRFVGGGVDAGIYYDYDTGEFGFFGDYHLGIGWDRGVGVTFQLAADPESLVGSFIEVEWSSTGLFEVNQNTGGVTSINLGTNFPTGPAGHISGGAGFIKCLLNCPHPKE